MPMLIDAHEDLAFNMLTYNRDYRRSALEIRRLEGISTEDPDRGLSLLGYPEYQAGQVAVVFGTLFAAPRRFSAPDEQGQIYDDFDQANKIYRGQIDFYRRYCEKNHDYFRLITTRGELADHLAAWDAAPANPPDTVHPVGLVMLMEGADGVRSPGELEEWWELGLRQIGLAWMGSRYCGATSEGGSITRDGYDILSAMARIGFTLDISHMNMTSALQALERYEGAVIASHSNARAIIKGEQGRWSERHLTDEVIRELIKRGGVMGLVPFNKFLAGGWEPTHGKDHITLENTIAVQIDHICQIAGNAHHVGIGTDFDGGFGAQATPREVDTIADLQKLGDVLGKRGYTEGDIRAILGGNWRRHLEEHLPTA